ncbi:MAG TPA: hypothetical protein VLC50_02655, partial [Actinomycetes bacterium]|nr:hypothetical protein [Actinomycetes bacterium]
GWTLTKINGTWTWISPTGHRYALDPVTVGTVITDITRHDAAFDLTDEQPPDPTDLEPTGIADLD